MVKSIKLPKREEVGPVEASSSAPVSGGGPLVRAAGRDPALVTFEVEVVSFFVGTAEILGVPKSVAAIYGIYFATIRPLSFADINERLNISQGSISQGIRVLREVGALKLVKTQERRDYFAPDLELRKVVTRFVEERLEKHLKTGKGRLQVMRACVPDIETNMAKEMKARLHYLQTWHDKSRAIVPLVKTFLKLA